MNDSTDSIPRNPSNDYFFMPLSDDGYWAIKLKWIGGIGGESATEMETSSPVFIKIGGKIGEALGLGFGDWIDNSSARYHNLGALIDALNDYETWRTPMDDIWDEQPHWH